ncbi:Sulfite reductase, ferredoxin [Anaerohalosphaera lusitana]|uniref:Sulfite reductase, ferredoxin n=1 Tax=Anaerohalosphaera lusitana TaxID=1936003 RepID=A0A1U9NIZ0_9BACT|nr:nitrite/sulfite reductase [Anaerohalosphaera lusitana]AQT67891.1 Sulfite reductase, ferredoxin [Anaerohalosphaera lusitana]
MIPDGSKARSILRLSEPLIRRARGHGSQVQGYLAGDISKNEFKSMGIYELRKDGKYMVRVRIGAGQVWSEQLERIAALSKEFGNSVVHVTTRQDFQIHGVSIEDTPAIMESLLEVGLASGGGGGNTVRNVTACPRSGVCPNEKFDVAPYAVAAGEFLLSDESSFALPRKFKVAFSGCSDDCAFAGINDLGFFAAVRNGNKGFQVYGGGGLGSKPRAGILIEEFISADDFLQVVEAMKLVFEEHGDRTNRRKARLRYVLDRVGDDEFVQLYKKAREHVTQDGLRGQVPNIRQLYPEPAPIEEDASDADLPGNIKADKQSGGYTVKVHVSMGDIEADDLLAVAQLASEHSAAPVRITQAQNLLITSVAGDDIGKVNARLGELGLRRDHNITVAACTGASTCRLGICRSREMGQEIEEAITNVTAFGTGRTIRVSGCPNSCGQHQIADLGLQGRLKRVDGEAVPHYDVYAGSDMTQGQTRLGTKIGTVSEKTVPEMIKTLVKKDGFTKTHISEIVSTYSG